MDLPLDHHVLHAAVVAGLLHLEPGVGSLEPSGSEVTSEEQRVVGVSGADPGDSDAGLSKDLLTERVTTFLALMAYISCYWLLQNSNSLLEVKVVTIGP